MSPYVKMIQVQLELWDTDFKLWKIMENKSTQVAYDWEALLADYPWVEEPELGGNKSDHIIHTQHIKQSQMPFMLSNNTWGY